MNKNKLIIIAVALAVVLIAGHGLWTHIKLSRLESAVRNAAAAAGVQQQKADELEKRSYEYKQKIEYLNAELGTVKKLAEKQDAQLAEISAETDAARRLYERARSGANGRPDK